MKSNIPYFVLTLTCLDQPGIVYDVSGFVVAAGGNILESTQYGDAETNIFSMRVKFSIDDETIEVETLNALFGDIGTRHDMNWTIHDSRIKPRVLILVSKFDHCLADLLYRQQKGELNIDIPLVVSNHPDAYKLAASYDIPYHRLTVNPQTKEKTEQWLLDFVESEGVDFVVLARYMQILSSEFCAALTGRVINIHHSFLPGFKGAKPYLQARARGVKLIGATAHYATVELDEGPIIEQDVARVTHSQSASELVAIGRDIETRVLARAVRYQAEHRIMLNGNKTVVFT